MINTSQDEVITKAFMSLADEIASAGTFSGENYKGEHGEIVAHQTEVPSSKNLSVVSALITFKTIGPVGMHYLVIGIKESATGLAIPVASLKLTKPDGLTLPDGTVDFANKRENRGDSIQRFLDLCDDFDVSLDI